MDPMASTAPAACVQSVPEGAGQSFSVLEPEGAWCMSAKYTLMGLGPRALKLPFHVSEVEVRWFKRQARSTAEDSD
ncbi:hypothetical protein E2562_011938 [Oryza meyeriana var. granulata]|uniref:Uncharacterized protein n=1 Tax=Oryza meyeriana var. granulata TaxID=110450 RepID=A0A6G1CFC3_9ORYZ|nr:hypothetical protein E2562_011938 [Oryza meyeriana var. granulata]